MPKIRKKQIFIFILAVIVLGFVTQIAPNLVKKVTATTTIEYGNLLVESEVTGYALRNETVYVAASSGSADFEVKETAQLKLGSKIMDFSKRASTDSKEDDNQYHDITNRLGSAAVVTDSEYARRKGAFSTYVDGYENYFIASNFDKIDEEDASKRAGEETDVKTSTIIKGDPMYKIVDQSKWYLMCWINSGDISKFEVGNRVTAKFDNGSVIFTIDKIVEEGSKWKMLLSSNRYYKDFAKFRDKKVNLIAKDLQGLIVDNKCLTTKDGKVGVYVISKTGDKVFKRVKTLGADGEKSILAENFFYDKKGKMIETVRVFDEILKNPKD